MTNPERLLVEQVLLPAPKRGGGFRHGIFSISRKFVSCARENRRNRVAHDGVPIFRGHVPDGVPTAARPCRGACSMDRALVQGAYVEGAVPCMQGPHVGRSCTGVVRTRVERGGVLSRPSTWAGWSPRMRHVLDEHRGHRADHCRPRARARAIARSAGGPVWSSFCGLSLGYCRGRVRFLTAARPCPPATRVRSQKAESALTWPTPLAPQISDDLVRDGAPEAGRSGSYV